MRKLIILICLLPIAYYLLPNNVYASDYVLPYPSYMPGHKLYRIHQIWEKFQEYWHFGDLAKFKYHRQMADKYLVEAKTLFEYHQYYLATKALEKSSSHFQKTALFLSKAAEEGKDISQKKAILLSAAAKHREILEELSDDLPEEFFWQEEKKEGERLGIRKQLEKAIEKNDLLTRNNQITQ